jgi:tRNA pseudouridine32 synthase/23S rRNA pseudouridine746 synthase
VPDSFFHIIPNAILHRTGVPERFTFPFYYTPHPLALYAVNELQEYLLHNLTVTHNFGLDEKSGGLVIGKMFGVLVVKNSDGSIGYLCAVSGKLGGTNQHSKFVPPVFDMLQPSGFFLEQEEQLNQWNLEIQQIENSSSWLTALKTLKEVHDTYGAIVEKTKEELKQNKKQRQHIRLEWASRSSFEEIERVEEELIQQSLADKRRLKQLTLDYTQKIAQLKDALLPLEEQLQQLKQKRKELSARLQKQLFQSYSFLNIHGQSKSLEEIFESTVWSKPPAAAGECATPKLLQHAFLHGYYPIAMAEFWWGAAPPSEVRQHKQYYPACTGKCAPILEHMLHSIPMDPNPLLCNPGSDSPIEIIFEDDALAVVYKPTHVLSVPGIHIQDSVYSRLKASWKIIEPKMVHRLDMGTSGLLVVAKTAEAHKKLQQQFIRHTIEKRYTAWLEGELLLEKGTITLPLRGDLENRPIQIVCSEFGKTAITEWEKVKVEEGKTLVHLWPKTGRTHQLRVHMAHPSGLGIPIVGDDLYGRVGDRLLLHADTLIFLHPSTKETLRFHYPAPF